MTDEELDAIVDRNLFHYGDESPSAPWHNDADIALLVAEIRRLRAVIRAATCELALASCSTARLTGLVKPEPGSAG